MVYATNDVQLSIVDRHVISLMVLDNDIQTTKDCPLSFPVYRVGYIITLLTDARLLNETKLELQGWNNIDMSAFIITIKLQI